MTNSDITFSFGENWLDYIKNIGREEIENAKGDLEEWLGKEYIQGKNILDIGSGSGIHSLTFFLLGAKAIFSFDYDMNSVEATRKLWEKAGKPANLTVTHGSILDKNFLETIGKGYDIVYSWGVLHHTGAMWEAIGNSISLLKPGGTFWITLYTKGSQYSKHLALKQKYNTSSKFQKKLMVTEK